MLLVFWSSYLKHGLLQLYSSLLLPSYLTHASSSYTPHFVVIIPQTWLPPVILLVVWPSYLTHASSSYTPHFVAIILQTRPPRAILLVLWPSYFKLGFLELCSSFCGHHTSNMASSSYAPRFVDTIPQAWPP